MELFFSSFQNIFFFTFLSVHSSLKTKKLKKLKDPDLPIGSFFSPPGPQETIFYLRVALVTGKTV